MWGIKIHVNVDAIPEGSGLSTCIHTVRAVLEPKKSTSYYVRAGLDYYVVSDKNARWTAERQSLECGTDLSS